MSLWNEIQDIDNKVKSGELDISGRLQLPNSGDAILFHVEIENKEGRNYILFYFTNEECVDYRKYEIRCPIASDSDNAKYMGMQNIYNTLFGAMNLDPKTIKVDACYDKVSTLLKGKSIKIKYECEETKYIAQRGARQGKEVSSVFLRKITAIAATNKVNIEIKKRADNYSSWNDNYVAEETPF